MFRLPRDNRSTIAKPWKIIFKWILNKSKDLSDVDATETEDAEGAEIVVDILVDRRDCSLIFVENKADETRHQ